MAKPKGIKSLSESVDASEIVVTDEEMGTVNFMIDDDYGCTGSYGDYQLVERKVAYRTGKPEDGENEGKVIQYIKWEVVTPHSYGRTPFAILENYAEYINLKKFKKLNKEKDFDSVKQIYLDTQSTIRKAMKSTQFSSDIVEHGTLINEIAELKAKLKSINDVLKDADELRELIKEKRRIVISETEPKKHRTKKEEE